MATEGGVTVQVTKDDMVAIINALNDVLHGPDAIEEWEFSARMGVERSEAKRLIYKLNDLFEVSFPKYPNWSRR